MNKKAVSITNEVYRIKENCLYLDIELLEPADLIFVQGEAVGRKSFALEEIEKALRNIYPEKTIIREKTRQWVMSLLMAIRDQQTNQRIGPLSKHEKMYSYRTADVLLLEELEFVDSKEATQSELAFLFEAIWEHDGLIILSSTNSFDDPIYKNLYEKIMRYSEGGKIIKRVEI